MRKTYSVEQLKRYINDFIHNSEDDCKDAREHMGRLLENVLMETDNYRGFAYLNVEDMCKSIHGSSVGIYEYLDGTHSFTGTDHTRVVYN